MQMLNGKPFYEVGDVVIAKRDGNRLRGGQKYVVVRSTTKEVIDILSIRISGHGLAHWFIHQNRVQIAGGCNECIYSCKGKEKCGVFTERGK